MRIRAALFATLGLLLISPPAATFGADGFSDPARSEDGLAEALAALADGRFDEALPWVDALVENGNRHGLLLRALMEFTGAGVVLDREAGMEHLRLAADKGNATAARELLVAGQPWNRHTRHWQGISRQDDLRTPDLPATLAYEGRGRLHLRFRAAIAWNREQAAAGDPIALYNLAHYAELAPNLMDADRKEAVSFWVDALRSGSRPALHEVQRRFDAGDLEETEQNQSLIAALSEETQRSAVAGDAESQFILGRNGVAEARDPNAYQEALDWLVAAANQQHDAAGDLLSEELARTEPPSWNEDDTRARRDEAASNGDVVAQARQLVDAIGAAEDLPRTELRALEQLAFKDSNALVLYADALLAAPEIKDVDAVACLDALQAAWADGNLPAGNRAAQFLLKGVGGIDEQPAAARRQLEEVARRGDLTSQLDLYFLSIGQHPTLGDPERARRYREEFGADFPAFERVLSALLQKQRNETRQQDTTPPDSEELAQLQAAFLDREADAQPVPVFQCKPIFPLELRANNINGSAIISFVVDTKGVPREVEVVEASEPDFGLEAIAAVSRWRFAPGLKDGRPVNTRMQVPIVFNILDE